MKTYALITEGRTDQAVIENILHGFLGTYDADVNWLLPLRDDTDLNRSENFSNWALFTFSKLLHIRSKTFHATKLQGFGLVRICYL